MKKHFKYLLLLALLTLPACFSLFKPGFFESHDGSWMVIRFSAFHQSLVDGHFPVRWSQRLNHGFGYPVLNFLYPLPFYLAELFYFFTNSFVLSIKLVFITSFIFSSLFMYLFLQTRFSKVPSLAGALLYLYTPYRFIDTYIRGSIGESLGFVFIPLIFLSIDLLIKHPRKALILGGLSLAATILSHNVFFIFAILGFLYGFITLPTKYYNRLILMSLVGACLSSFFWFPALSELKFTFASNLQVASPTDHLASLRQLIIPQAPKIMSYQLGLVNIAVVLIALKHWFKKRQKISIFFITTFILAAFLMQSLSLPFWLLPFIGIIQFPWRLLSLTTFASSFLVANFKKTAPVFAILALATTLIYAQPSTHNHLPDTFYSTNEDTTTVQAEYTPIWVQNPPTQRALKPWEIVKGDAKVLDYTQTNILKTFTVQANQVSTLKLASLYYPGWNLHINGDKSPIKYSQYDGRLAFDVPAGESQIKFYWQETPLRQISNSLSLATLIGLVLYCIKIYL